MKILKEGKLPEKKFHCGRCGTVFVARENESTPIGFDMKYLYCPMCESRMMWDDGEDYQEQ